MKSVVTTYNEDKTGHAVFSADGKYRYELGRRLIIPQASRIAIKRSLLIMLNPSDANAFEPDPTITRVCSFSRREKCTELTVCNLYSFISPYPEDLLKTNDPVGPYADFYLMNNIRSSDLIICGWGNEVLDMTRVRQVWDMLKNIPHVFCLGINKNGSPRHPLYIKGTAPLISWRLHDS